jgi:hypothetical protein
MQAWTKGVENVIEITPDKLSFAAESSSPLKNTANAALLALIYGGLLASRSYPVGPP